MKHAYITTAVLLALGLTLAANTDILMLYFQNGDSKGFKAELLKEITFAPGGDIESVTLDNGAEIGADGLELMQFEDASDTVEITLRENGAAVRNPLYGGVTTQLLEGGYLVVNTKAETTAVFKITGSTTAGSVNFYGDYPAGLNIVVDNATIASGRGPALNIQAECEVRIELRGVSKLTDASDYNLPEGEKAQGCLASLGSINLVGEGSVVINGRKKHGVNTEVDFMCDGPDVTVSSSMSDGVHFGGKFTLKSGMLDLTPGSDAVDGDGDMSISGGTLKATIASATSKGLKAGGKTIISGGEIDLTLTGGVTVESGDPSYCTGIKAKDDMMVSGGSITMKHSGAAGKGISADGRLDITGGYINIYTSGNGSTYTTASNTTDSYSATCIKADGDLTILGGEIICESTGSAGKCINTDGALVIGDTQQGPSITAKTSGAKFSVGSSSSGGGWGGWGGGPGGSSTDYANPKAIKAQGNLTVNNGVIKATTTKDGGEGLESKATLTINGGEIELNTYDDGINAANAIVINGGKIFVNASGNDGIDSNGTITISGGVILTSGATSPEEGFDCDNNQFRVTGGILMGIGGSTSNPTSSVCTQNVAVQSVSSISKDAIWAVCDASGNALAIFTMPKTLSGSAVFLFSHPDLKLSSSYTIKRGVSVSGNTEAPWCGYYADGQVSGGTTVTTFTQSSVVTGGSSSGGRP